MGEIYCVRKEDVPVKEGIQKISIEPILNNARVFDSIESAVESGYVPITLALSMRTLRSNKVVEVEVMKTKGYVVNISNEDINCELVNKEDKEAVILFNIANLISYHFDTDGWEDFPIFVANNTVPQLIGVVYNQPEDFNPIFYYHILIDDRVEEEFSRRFIPSCRFVPIEDAKKNWGDVFTDSLIIV